MPSHKSIKITTNLCCSRSQTNSKRMSNFTESSFTPLRLWSGTARIPGHNSNTGRQVCPARSSFLSVLDLWTSILSRASSGTVNGKSNSSSHIGVQSSYIVLVLFILVSAGTPPIPTWKLKHKLLPMFLWKVDRIHHCYISTRLHIIFVRTCKVLVKHEQEGTEILGWRLRF